MRIRPPQTKRLLAVFLAVFACSLSQAKSGADDGQLLAARHSSQPARPGKQIYEVSSTIQESILLKASGVSAYVISTMGRNRGILLKDVTNSGLASSMGMSPGDVLLSFDNHVIADARDADRVLASIPTGNIRVMFVHPGDNGLQLYNGNVHYINVSANMPGLSSGGSHSSEPSSHASAAAQSDKLSFLPECESYGIELINKDRKDHGSNAISGNSNLTALARIHAADMMTRNFFDHVNPDGEDPQARARKNGIVGGVYENISWQQAPGGNPAASVTTCEARMMSEPPNEQNHRYNILLPGHQSVGVGVARKGAKVIMVQEFSDGSP